LAHDAKPAAPVELLTGRCMCEQVRFKIEAALVAALYCHCRRCQRRSGTAFSATAATIPGSFRLVAGAELVSSSRPADGWEKFFCCECGSHLYTTDPADPQKLSVRMGALDSDPGIRPSVHQFTAYAAAWDPLLDDQLPKFPERLPSRTQAPPATE
jgi:hypothetical protein